MKSIQYKSGKADYLDVLANTNKLSEQGFEEWIFHPGMTFHSRMKWWSRGKRDTPHEGLDLCLYRDRNGNIRRLDQQTTVPAIFSGDIIRVIDDFIGRTIYIRHDMHDERGRYLCTMYGHILPSDDCSPGKAVGRHAIIGSVAPCSRKKGPPPHLHISIAWIPETVPHSDLGWETLSRSKGVTFLDPLAFLQCPCQVSEGSPVEP